MVSKRLFILAFLLLVVVMAILALPVALRAIPPRYAARFLPKPLLALTVPEQKSPILPTVAKPADASFLLEPAVAATAVAILPPTFTPPPTAVSNELVVEATAVPLLPPTQTPTPVSTPIPIPPAARIAGVRHEFQEWNNCGPATLAMTLSVFDLNLTQRATAPVLKPNPEDRNVSPHEMAAFVNERTDFQALVRVNGQADTVKRLAANGIPVILEIGIEPPGEFRWMGWYGHYMLVVAYDDAQEQFWIYDSWLGTSEVPLENAGPDGRILTYEALERDWPHFNRNYIVVYRPDQAQLVADIIGPDMDDDVMWRNNLEISRQDATASPENAFYWFNLGTAYNALGDYESAAAAFDQARTIGLPWRMLWYQFGPYEAYYQAGRYEDVILLADTTLKDRPYFEESFYYKGLAQAALGDAKAARKSLEKAADLNPNFAPAASALAQMKTAVEN